jgi:hypothetical protein
VASTPFPAVPLARVAGPRTDTAPGSGPLSVLASPAAQADLGGTAAQLTSPAAMGPIGVRVAGTVTSIPGQPAGSAFLVMEIQRLPGPLGVPAVNRILITGSGISTAAMSAVILRQLPGASTAFRSAALATLASSPLQHGADLILPLTIATAAGFGLFILMLGVALSAPDRALTLARLTVMGHERATGLVLLEALPAVVVAVAAGAACALALPPLVGSDLDLSVFTGPGTGHGPARLDLTRPASRGGAPACGGAGHRGAQAQPTGRGPDAAKGVSGASAAGGDGTGRVGDPVGPGAHVERGRDTGQREGEDLMRRGDP